VTPRHFTRGEAESVIPRLTELVLQLKERKHEYDSHEMKVAELTTKMRGNGHMLDDDLRQARAGLERTATEVNELVQQVSEMGCELKGIEEGLIDFRTEMHGREVYLCWKLGEDSIAWWHELDTGFGGRQPLEAQ
jgi:hypothetical protein